MENNLEKQLADLVESIINYTEKIPNGSIKIAQFLRNGESDRAFNSIVDFIEGIDWLISSINILLNYNYTITFDKSLLNSLLNEINDAMKNKNESLLADLFEYEISEFFELESNLIIEKL